MTEEQKNALVQVLQDLESAIKDLYWQTGVTNDPLFAMKSSIEKLQDALAVDE